jgi:hypothetical protein
MVTLRLGVQELHTTDLRDPAQKFLTPRPARFTGAFTSLGTLFSRGVKSSRRSLYLLRGTAHTDFHLSAGYFFATLVLHVAAVVLMLRFVHFTVAAESFSDPVDLSDAKIYYFPPKAQEHHTMPKIAPKGPGSVPGRGEPTTQEAPARKSTAFHKSLTVVSNPRTPDNYHQTIIQASSPPDLKIKEDLHVPNIVIGNPMAQPKNPTIALHWQAPAPKQTAAKNLKNSAAPQVPDQKWVDLTIVGNIVPNAGLPVAPPQEPMKRPSAPKGGPAASAIPDTPGSSGGAGSHDLIVIGTNPNDAATQLALPPGNRYGSFSLSPDAAGEGSVGGTAAKNGAGAGTEGSGPGGNVSSGVGSGSSGGGGGDRTSETGSVSISTSSVGEGSSADPALKSAMIESMVYPVERPAAARRNSMIVSSGAVGGGGLAVYKALQCGKIYTIFIAMPGGAWTLEYCKEGQSGAPPEPTQSGDTSVIHMDPGLVPPDALETFDFKRLPVPETSQRKQIILRGVIDADGSVKEAKIYFGLQAQMDEAARVAFSKWKFKPALQLGKPVPIEFLVGISPRNQ